jgi:hypothetical protein
MARLTKFHHQQFLMVSMLKTTEFGSSTEIVHKFRMISAYNRPIICEYSVRNIRSKRDMHLSCNCVQLALLGIMPWPTPIYGCNMAVLVASGISCIEVWWLTDGCNWNGAIA